MGIEATRRWQAENPERVRAAGRKFDETHREERAAAAKSRYNPAAQAARYAALSAEEKQERYRKNEARKKQKVQYVQQLKADMPCVDCGGFFHYAAMDFDHKAGARDEGDDSVAFLAHHGASLKRIDAEISKCDLVCANCHRLRTWQRLRASASDTLSA